jgi:hypothetical protein
MREDGITWDQIHTAYNAWQDRMAGLQRILEAKGGFSRVPSAWGQSQAHTALWSRRSEDTEPIALWLRGELKKLRAGEKQVGAAPVLSGNALSRLVIADIAMTMLEACECPGENLRCLLRELFDLDRHRWALGEKRNKAFEDAAEIDARATYGLRELARQVRVSPSTLKGWRASPDYQRLVARYRDDYDN